MTPTETAADSSWEFGSTVPIITSKPPPSGPSLVLSSTSAPSATIGAESLPRRPSPSNRPVTASPGVLAGTSQIVLGPSADTGFDDHTYAVACSADVTQLFFPSSRI